MHSFFYLVLRAIRLLRSDRRGILLTPWSGRVSCNHILVEANSWLGQRIFVRSTGEKTVIASKEHPHDEKDLVKN